MPRKLVAELDDGGTPVLEEVPADDELQLQERLKAHPDLLPLEEVGLVGPAVVVGRESRLDSGRIDLVLLGNGGDLALIEFKTGPQNPDFRECLAQLLDYGSDLWGMSLEDFESRVAQAYFRSAHCPSGSVAPGASLDDVVAAAWGEAPQDAVDWRERLQMQLRNGSFHYIAVAQRFTPPVLKTLEYLNATMKASRFSAVELIRFSGGGYSAFEARFVAGASTRGTSGAGTDRASLAGVDDFLAMVTDDPYRHSLHDLFEGLDSVPGLIIFWGTTGCSLRVQIAGRAPLSIGWIFPPGPSRWMGLTHVTLGWYEDANGLALAQDGEDILAGYLGELKDIPGGVAPRASSIKGLTFPPDAVVAHAERLQEIVRSTSAALVEL